MTKLFEQAIARVRKLPDEDQDTLEPARRGEFVPEAEIEAIWKRHGL